MILTLGCSESYDFKSLRFCDPSGPRRCGSALTPLSGFQPALTIAFFKMKIPCISESNVLLDGLARILRI